MTPENRTAYHRLRDGVAAWLAANQIPYVVPEPLASPLYADASHPLTEGYRELAEQLRADAAYQRWASPR